VILSKRNILIYDSAPFRQAKTDRILVRYKPGRKFGSDDAWFVHWWAARHPVWELTELEASSGLNTVQTSSHEQLHTYGLLQASFRPAEEIRAVRSLVRHRENLIQSCTREIQHMQKALQQMNVKLTNVITDITGVTGMLIMRDIVSGERDPVKLSQHRNVHCAMSEAEIAKSLQGHYKPEHVFELKQALEAYDFYQRQVKACDAEIEQCYAAFEPRIDDGDKPLPPPKRKRSKPSKNTPGFNLRLYLYRWAGVDLTQIDGPDALTIQKVLTETGVDMSPWPTVKHFTSWLSL
jgi:transposase